jgi:hypothetical protein
MDAVLCRDLRQKLRRSVIVGAKHDHPAKRVDAVAQALGLVGETARLGRVQAAVEGVQQVAAQSPFHLGGRSLLGHLQRQHGGAVLQRLAPAGVVHCPRWGEPHQRAQQLVARAHGHEGSASLGLALGGGAHRALW